MSLESSQSLGRSREEFFHWVQLDFQSILASPCDFPYVYPKKWGDVPRNEWDHTGLTHSGLLSQAEFAEETSGNVLFGLREKGVSKKVFCCFFQRKTWQKVVQNMERTWKIRTGKMTANDGMNLWFWGHLQPWGEVVQTAKPQLLPPHSEIQIPYSPKGAGRVTTPRSVMEKQLLHFLGRSSSGSAAFAHLAPSAEIHLQLCHQLSNKLPWRGV